LSVIDLVDEEKIRRRLASTEGCVDSLFDKQEVRKNWEGETSLERAGKRQTVYNIIHRLNDLKVTNLIEEAEVEEIDRQELKGILDELRTRGLIYAPRRGYVGCVED